MRYGQYSHYVCKKNAPLTLQIALADKKHIRSDKWFVSPVRRQIIIETHAGLLSFGP